MEFKDKVAVITGGASGIGRACALAMAKVGADIVVADLDDTGLETVCQEIRQLNRRALGVHCNVSITADVENLALKTFSTMGKADILMNNAGVALRGLPENLTVENWEWIVGINLLGAVRGVHAFLPHMLQRGSGYIINTASAVSFQATEPPEVARDNIAYATTKFGLLGFSEGLFGYLKPKGIAVSVLCPHWVATNLPMHSRYMGLDSKEIQMKPVELQNEKAKFSEAEGVQKPEDIGEMLVEGMKEERYLILTFPPYQEHLKEDRGQDLDKLEKYLQKLVQNPA